MSGAWTIRPARPDELDALAAIEIDAYPVYATATGLDPAEASATPRHLMEGSLADEALFVAAVNDIPIGFVACTIRDGWLYVGELDVCRAWQRRGVGRSLMLHALAETGRRGLPGAMLTTDRHAPFNAPFYASVGFRETSPEAVPPSLRAVLRDEIARGHDPRRRVAMLWTAPAGA